MAISKFVKAPDGTKMRQYVKYPSELKDYHHGLRLRMTDDDFITDVTHAPNSEDLVVEDEGYVGSIVSVWLSGGNADANYWVGCDVTTDAGRVIHFDFPVLVRTYES